MTSTASNRPTFAARPLCSGAMLVLGLAGFGGCAWEPLPTRGGAAPAAATKTLSARPAERAAATARRLIGVPYLWGGSTPAGFDCSGLIAYAFGKEGVDVPRTARELRSHATPIALRDARPGDLVFFDPGNGTDHVGIVSTPGRFVHAPSTGKRVREDALTKPYYRRTFIGAGRLR